MNLELKPEEIVYDFNIKNVEPDKESRGNKEYEDIRKKIKMALDIEREGYNIYIVDDFSKSKIKDIANYIYENVSPKQLEDICYVVYDSVKKPRVLFLRAGFGNKLADMIKKIKELYYKITFEFYNGSYEKKEEIIEYMDSKKNGIVAKMMDDAKEKGFTIKPTRDGFVFIPVKSDGKAFSEEEYELLSPEKKQEILDNVKVLKASSNKVIDELKDMESVQVEKIKLIMDDYYKKNTANIKKEYYDIFFENKEALSYLDNVCSSIEENIRDIYSIDYDEDEKKIKDIILKYSVNVMVDNGGRDKVPVIYEDDPSIINLLGNIEYQNKDGNYVTDISLIKAGSMLRANGGCLILRINNLLANPNAYYYLKKSLINGKVNIDYKRGYMEILSLDGLKPEPVKFREKVILVGDYNIFNLIYNYDPDFKKIFRIKAERRYVLNIDDDVRRLFIEKIVKICKQKNLKPVTDEGIREIAKFSSRKAEDRNKLYIDDYELEKVITISNNNACGNKSGYIETRDIENAIYREELIKEQMQEGYKQKQIFIDTEGKKVGQVNGLSILDAGYFSFGRPVRITCSCVKGTGEIFDVQRESSLSGKIHTKAVNTIKGYINNLIGGYSKLPVDFHMSFEQIYGTVDGDSASIAEIAAIISSLSKMGIKQNIAVTGSVNQFGEVQPVGGINQKIEGFFDICRIVDDSTGRGVIIPESNKTSLALKNEVEDEIKEGRFHIYSVKTVDDAMEVLMGDAGIDFGYIIDQARKECRKYIAKQGRAGRHG